MKLLVLTAVVFLSLNVKIIAGQISGFADVTDGDTIKILNNKIRLHGIDAPEKKQKCTKDAKDYNCGVVATQMLIKKISGNTVKCLTQKNKDRYNRFIGVCFVKQEDINKWMVRNGYAVAYKRYSEDYTLDENFAKTNKLGLWSGSFLKPEKWRKLN
ncbi:thermonuclease family protein [Pelagibacteraceae bacterium]|nr:thermonuclease family protein [Pelagibacteraceae bacterium]|tara:strand:+ start:443 stop:913 length:471 start_codon:yes stop_codon:yes gene_type:complete